MKKDYNLIGKIVSGDRLNLFLSLSFAERKKYTRSCFGKRRYRDIREAKEVADFYKRKDGVFLRIYKCRLCEGYHLTKKAKHKFTNNGS